MPWLSFMPRETYQQAERRASIVFGARTAMSARSSLQIGFARTRLCALRLPRFLNTPCRAPFPACAFSDGTAYLRNAVLGQPELLALAQELQRVLVNHF